MNEGHHVLPYWDQILAPGTAGEALPQHHRECLGCGTDNPHGHHLEAYLIDGAVVATHAFGQRHVGAPGIAHGGAVTTVIDDLFGFLVHQAGSPAVTRHLEVDFLAPVLLGVPYSLRAELTAAEGRKSFVAASVTDPDGRVVARSTALFLAVDRAHFEQRQGPSSS